MDIIEGLSPDEKARIAIEDLLRPTPMISPSDYRKMLAAMEVDEGRRFNAFISHFQILRQNLDRLLYLVMELQTHLLNRDRVLWYLHGLEELDEAISFDIFDSGVSKALLIDNPNLKPGKPLEIRVTLATVRLGVWGKKRIPVGAKSGVQPEAKVTGILSLYAAGIRANAGVVKALFQHVTQEARAMGLDFMRGLAIEIVDEVAKYDRSMKQIVRESEERFAKWERKGLTHEERLQRIVNEEPQPLAPCIFPVDDRWALEWDEIGEDEETARRLREDPEALLPSSYEGVPSEGLLEHFKAVSLARVDTAQ